MSRRFAVAPKQYGQADAARRRQAPGRTRLDWLIVLLLAVTIRVGYTIESPDTNPYRSVALEGTDLETYQSWAAAIATGKSCDSRFVPFPNAPVYPYLLGLCFAAFGGPILTLAAWINVLFGIANVAFGFAIARMLLGRWLALLAGVLMALARPWLVYEQLILSDTLALTLQTAMAWAMIRACNAKRPGVMALAGVSLGLSTVARPTSALLGIALLAYAYIQRRRSDLASVNTDHHGKVIAVAARKHVLVGVLAAAVPLLTFAVLHRVCGGPLSPLPATGAANLYIGNAPDASGLFEYPASYGHLTAGSAAPDFLPALFRAVADQPLAWTRVMLKKLLLTADGGCPAQNVSYDLLAQVSSWLDIAPWSLWPAAALGWLGAVICWQRREHLAPIYILLLASVLTTAAVFVVGRFKLPLLVPWTIFAAAAVGQFVKWVRSRRWLFVAGCAAGLSALLVGLSPNPNNDLRTVDVDNMSIAWTRLGRADQALSVRYAALSFDPNRVDLRLQLAATFAVAGRWQSMVAVLRDGLESTRTFSADGFALLVFAELKLGRPEEARRVHDEALRRFPDDAVLRARLQEIMPNPPP